MKDRNEGGSIYCNQHTPVQKDAILSCSFKICLMLLCYVFVQFFSISYLFNRPNLN